MKFVKKVDKRKLVYILFLFLFLLFIFIPNIPQIFWELENHPEHQGRIIFASVAVSILIVISVYIFLKKHINLWAYYILFAISTSFLFYEADIKDFFKLDDELHLLWLLALFAGMSFYFFYKPLREKAKKDKCYKILHRVFFISVPGFSLLFSNLLALPYHWFYKSYIIYAGPTGAYLFWTSLFFFLFSLGMLYLRRFSFFEKHFLLFTALYFIIIFVLLSFATMFLLIASAGA